MRNLAGLFFLLFCVQSSSVWAKDILLDVRTPDEYKQSHLPGAINMDVLNEDFKTRVATLSREDSYKVYCKGGKRATQAVTIMNDLGFKNLTNLGGYEDAQKTLHVRPITTP